MSATAEATAAQGDAEKVAREAQAKEAFKRALWVILLTLAGFCIFASFLLMITGFSQLSNNTNMANGTSIFINATCSSSPVRHFPTPPFFPLLPSPPLPHFFKKIFLRSSSFSLFPPFFPLARTNTGGGCGVTDVEAQAVPIRDGGR